MKQYTITLHDATGATLCTSTRFTNKRGAIFLDAPAFEPPAQLPAGLTPYKDKDALLFIPKGEKIEFWLSPFGGKEKNVKITECELDDCERVLTLHTGLYVSLTMELDTIQEIKRNQSDIEKAEAEAEAARERAKLIKLVAIAIISAAVAWNAELFIGLAVIIVAVIGGLK